jgi:hypothetical protein
MLALLFTLRPFVYILTVQSQQSAEIKSKKISQLLGIRLSDILLKKLRISEWLSRSIGSAVNTECGYFQALT